MGINVVLATSMILLGLYAFHWRSANAIVTTMENAESTINGAVREYQKHDYRDAVFDLGLDGGLLQTLGNLTHHSDINRLGVDLIVLGGSLAGNPRKEGPLVMQAIRVIRRDLQPTETPNLPAFDRQTKIALQHIANNPLLRP